MCPRGLIFKGQNYPQCIPRPCGSARYVWSIATNNVRQSRWDKKISKKNNFLAPLYKGVGRIGQSAIVGEALEEEEIPALMSAY